LSQNQPAISNATAVVAMAKFIEDSKYIEDAGFSGRN
jgi:hypothetical protein